jgi:spore coat protein W
VIFVQEFLVQGAYSAIVRIILGVINMSDVPQNPNIPNKLIDLLVSDIFKKNGVNLEEGKGKLSAEEKQMIKELVDDLRKQVDAFVNRESSSNESDK